MMTLPIMTDNAVNCKSSISNGVKLSKHTVFYDLPAPLEVVPNGTSVLTGLAYNTRTQGILGINKEVKEFIGRVTSPSNVIASRPGGMSLRGSETTEAISLGTISSGLLRRPSGTPRNDKLGDEEQSCLNTLLDSGIIVDRETDEDKVLEDWFEEIRFRPRALHATILTTFKCNFACTYCFEEGVKKGIATSPLRDSRNDTPSMSLRGSETTEAISMDEQTADEVIEFLKAKAVEKNSPRIRLMFYGGEPLMNPGAIIRIATALKQWTAERGTKFSFGMITNGSLVRKELMEQLVKLGLTSIRITLDGDKEVHDRRRPYLDGRGTFDTIVRNIEEVLQTGRPADQQTGGPKIELGANFDRDNIAGLHRLLDYLEQKGLNKRIARVLFAPVVSRLAGDEALTVEPVGCHKLSGELAEEGIKLEKELIQRGYNTPSSVQVSACPMTMDDSMLVIDPSGGLYKCEAFAGREQFCIGNVREPRFNHRYAEFLALKPWKECLDCPYVPMCGGGCRYIAQLKHSDYTKRACDKEYYEKIFPQLLKMDYERGVL